MLRRTGVVLLALVLVAATLTMAPGSRASAAPTGVFDPSYIISDAAFYDSNSMNAGQIQQFFQGQSCTPRDGVPCLRDFRATTPSKAAVGGGHCSAYAGASNESAATIVFKVSQACGISPKVLLVLMQKEQSLVTSPSSYGYQRAMGWGCPDTGGCDANWYGFFNQVYKSAWQFREYTQYPSEWRYRIGPTYVQYNPNTACGGTTVNIRNQATANLYIYTPYQPNAAALANLYGVGDGCSSYGNRNFWRMYFDWFGSPTDSSPLGLIENMQAVPGGVGIWGWAIDTDTPDPLQIHVYVDGRMAGGYWANGPRPDLQSRYGLGANHGFSIAVATGVGMHNVCAYAINVGPGENKTLGCYDIRVGGDPRGSIDNIQLQPGGLGVWGWAADPDTSDPISVHFYVDGVMAKGITADASRSDMGSLMPGYGAKHGFATTLATAPGPHQVCAYAINVGSGSVNTNLGCYTVTSGGNPFGSLGQPTSGLTSVTVGGWAIDPDTKDPIGVHIYMDGTMVRGITANGNRTDLGIFSTFGANHGYSATFPATNGRHTVCAYGINTGAGNVNTQLGCQTVDVGGPPRGVLENGQPGFASVSVWGYAFDPDTAAPTAVHVYVDGLMKGGFTADIPRPDLAGALGEYGTSHGFAATVPATPGQHQICVYGINIGYGQNSLIDCFTTVVDGDPVGAVENVQQVGDGFGVWGYALDPDTTSPIAVHIYVDGTMAGGFMADQARADLATRFPGFGSAHAFGAQVPASVGRHEVCAYGINVGTGANTELGCVTVTRS